MKSFIVGGVILLAGLAGTQVHAHWFGSGWGMTGGMMGSGWGYGSMMEPGFCQGYPGYGPEVYSKETQEKIAEFSKETEGLRQELRQKYFELQNLLNQRTPDEDKILAKQKEISQIQAQLDEKELKFQLKNPNLTTKRGRYCRGPGMGWIR